MCHIISAVSGVRFYTEEIWWQRPMTYTRIIWQDTNYPKRNLNYRSSKEIYLNLWIGYFSNGERRVNDLGSFKDLSTSNESMNIMANLLVDLSIEEYSYVNANLVEFTWEGADIPPFDDDGKRIDWAIHVLIWRQN